MVTNMITRGRSQLSKANRKRANSGTTETGRATKIPKTKNRDYSSRMRPRKQVNYNAVPIIGLGSESEDDDLEPARETTHSENTLQQACSTVNGDQDDSDTPLSRVRPNLSFRNVATPASSTSTASAVESQTVPNPKNATTKATDLEFAALRDEVERWKSEATEAKRSLEKRKLEKEVAQKEADDLRNQHRNITDRIQKESDEKGKELEARRNECNKLSKRLDSTNTGLIDLRKRNQSLQSELHKEKDISKEVNGLRVRMKALEKESAELRKANDTLSLELDTSEQTKEELEEQLEELRQTNAELEENLEDAENERACQWDAQVARTKKLSTQLTELQKSYSKLRFQKEELERQLQKGPLRNSTFSKRTATPLLQPDLSATSTQTTGVLSMPLSEMSKDQKIEAALHRAVIRYNTLRAPAANLMALTKGMSLSSFGDFGRAVRQLEDAFQKENEEKNQ